MFAERFTTSRMSLQRSTVINASSVPIETEMCKGWRHAKDSNKHFNNSVTLMRCLLHYFKLQCKRNMGKIRLNCEENKWCSFYIHNAYMMQNYQYRLHQCKTPFLLKMGNMLENMYV